jgi:hypothetical protein
MNKEKFTEATNTGYLVLNGSVSTLKEYTNLLLDEIIKELQELKLGIYDDGSLSSVHDIGENFGIDKAIKTIEAMK